MEKINCPSCGSNEYKHTYDRIDALMQVDDQIFTIVQCSKCGLFYQNPRPSLEEMKKYYPERYYRKKINPEKLLADNEKFLRRKFKKIEKFKPARLLDIGAQKGEFLEYSRRQINSLEVIGIDLDDRIPNLFNLQFKYGYAWEIDLPKGEFDIITMWEVFEHIHKPSELLEKIHDWLNISGILILSLPNFNSINRRLMQAEDLPRHLYMFTPSSISDLLEKFGFEVFRKDYVRSIFPNTSKELLVFWYKKWIQRKDWNEILIEYTTPNKERKSFGLFLVRILDRLIMIPLQWFLNFFGFSSNMVIFARKKSKQ